MRKSYTEEELQAAVSDIRCGKLGTRRAAVLYGIPRSTLRNKIFKLDNESSHSAAPASSNGMSDSESQLCMNDLLQSSGAFSNVPFIGFGFPGLVEDPYPWLVTPSSLDLQDRLDTIRRKHNLYSPDRKFGSPPPAANCGAFVDAESVPVSYLDQLGFPLLPELVHKLAKERVNQERIAADIEALVKERPSPVKATKLPKKPIAPPVELKIPSYKPMRSYNNGFSHPALSGADDSDSSNYTGNQIGDALKNMIAKSIADKARSRSQKGSCTDIHDEVMNGHCEPDSKKVKLENGVNGVKNSKKKDNKDGNKKTRPKRGQYRKYNSQLLVEAVKAVQRGEMSVHRAGSYFGVPHSTLEYKVKERHLLRQKKPRDSKKKSGDDSSSLSTLSGNGSSSNGSGSGSGSESGEGQGSPGSADSPTKSSTPVLQKNIATSLAMPFPLTLTWSQSSSSPSSPSLTSSPYNFSLNTSASELLKKLQRKVQAKASLDAIDDMPPMIHTPPSNNEVVAQ